MSCLRSSVVRVVVATAPCSGHDFSCRCSRLHLLFHECKPNLSVLEIITACYVNYIEPRKFLLDSVLLS